MSDKTYPTNSDIEESPESASVVETVKTAKQTNENEATKKVSFLRRFSSIRSTVTPNLQVVRKRVRKLNCFKSSEDDECDIPMDIPRHRSIDISVGLARRASLFLFRRKSVCMHPYHPFTPKATWRKIYFGADMKKYAE